MSNLVRFEKVDNELNILRIGGKSFLPPDVEWPTNPNGEKMVFIFNIPTNFLNSTLQFNYPKDQVISLSITISLAEIKKSASFLGEATECKITFVYPFFIF